MTSDHHYARERAHATRRRTMHGESLSERESRDIDLDLSLTLPPAREAFLSERLLARWLLVKLGTVGARAMVGRYGVRAILEALYDNIVQVDPDRGLVVNRALKSPGGYLRWVLGQGERG